MAIDGTLFGLFTEKLNWSEYESLQEYCRCHSPCSLRVSVGKMAESLGNE